MTDWVILITLFVVGSIASLIAGKRTKYQMIIWLMSTLALLTIHFFFK
ncbi:hypothetical protein [Alkalihalobacillus pseudalcaliphilus]|nr:hypothetical protein [Alkalihalobacillus pseudalcaliphilus]